MPQSGLAELHEENFRSEVGGRDQNMLTDGLPDDFDWTIARLISASFSPLVFIRKQREKKDTVNRREFLV